MSIKQTPNTNWLTGIVVGASIPIILIVLGITIELASWVSAQIHFVRGPEDTTLENAILFGGLYFALPYGILSIVAGIFARSKDLIKKSIATMGIVIGVLGILIGILAWVLSIMLSSFVF